MLGTAKTTQYPPVLDSSSSRSGVDGMNADVTWSPAPPPCPASPPTGHCCCTSRPFWDPDTNTSSVRHIALTAILQTSTYVRLAGRLCLRMKSRHVSVKLLSVWKLAAVSSPAASTEKGFFFVVWDSCETNKRTNRSGW